MPEDDIEHPDFVPRQLEPQRAAPEQPTPNPAPNPFDLGAKPANPFEEKQTLDHPGKPYVFTCVAVDHSVGKKHFGRCSEMLRKPLHSVDEAGEICRSRFQNYAGAQVVKVFGAFDVSDHLPERKEQCLGKLAPAISDDIPPKKEQPFMKLDQNCTNPFDKCATN